MRDNVAYAGFAVRFFAWLTDALVLSVPLSALYGVRLFSAPSGFAARPLLFRYSLLDIAVYLLPVLYFTLTTLTHGATLGKTLLNLEVVSADGKPLTFWQVLLRELVGRYLSTVILCIGYLIAVPDAEKRALHDRIADTRVVYAIRPSRPAWRPGKASRPAVPTPDNAPTTATVTPQESVTPDAPQEPLRENAPQQEAAADKPSGVTLAKEPLAESVAPQESVTPDAPPQENAPQDESV